MPRSARENRDYRPIIGISPNLEVDSDHVFVARHYMERILQAGGIPVELPYGAGTAALAMEVAERVDGILLSGGGDVHPDGFSGKAYDPSSNAPIYGESTIRDDFEQALLEAAWNLDVPTLGICRGIQVMNVSRGGSLWRDIKEQPSDDVLKHFMDAPYDRMVHHVSVDPTSRLAELLGGTEFDVNSIHHECIAEGARGGKIVAWAQDGTPEALEFPDKTFFVGVQWHPEITGTMPQLFEGLVKAAAQKMELSAKSA